MANLQQFDASSVMRQISKIAPFALLVFALLSFVAVGIFTVDYYNQLFEPRFGNSAQFMAIMCATIQEAVRFGLLVASIRDFSDSKPANGWLGLIGSIGMVLHDVKIAKQVGLLWNPDSPEAYTGILFFLIVTGLLLEVRLILTVSGKSSSQAVKKASNGQASGNVAKQLAQQTS